MTLTFFTASLSRLLVCTATLLALGACSSGSSSGDGESALPGTTAPDDSAAGPVTPPASTPDTPAGDTPSDTPAPSGDTATPPDDTPVTPPSGMSAGEISGNAQFFGFVGFSQTSGQFASADVSAGFIKFNRSFPTTGITDQLVGAEDSCTVESIDLSGDDDLDIPGIDDIGIEFVSAGDAITVLSPAGSYVELTENTEFGFSFYVPTIEELPTPIPADLIVNIPGRVFPAFTNVAVPNVEPLVVTNDDGTNGSYTWVAGTNPNARISIEFSGMDSSNPGTSSTSVSCIAADDGEFSIPASVTSQLPAGYSVTYTDFSRSATSFFQAADAILMITNSSGE